MNKDIYKILGILTWIIFFSLPRPQAPAWGWEKYYNLGGVPFDFVIHSYDGIIGTQDW